MSIISLYVARLRSYFTGEILKEVCNIPKDIRNLINRIDNIFVILLLIGTLIIATFSIMDFILNGKGIVTREALYNYFLGLNGIYLNVVVSGIIFIVILLFYLVYFINAANRKDTKNDNGNVSELFFFMFLWMAAISSITPPINHITRLFGQLGLTTYYEETTIYFSIIIVLSALVSFSALNMQIGVGIRKSLAEGYKYRLRYYLFSVIPASISTGIFLIQNQVTLVYAAIFFLLFLSVMLFIQRYGFIRGMATVGIIFGSEIIPNYFRGITGPMYDLFIFAFVALGFISLVYPYNIVNRKLTHGEDSHEDSKDPDQLLKEPKIEENVVPEAYKKPQDLGSKNSREMADDLFIRGTCPYCDSVEFYYNTDGTLTCKKCKAILTGKETTFNSFNVMKGGRRR